MLLKETEYERCLSCGHIKNIIHEEIYGCDNCRKEIDINRKGTNYLRIQVFYHEGETKEYQLCSWKCVFKLLPKLKTDYFISLPFLSYDNKDQDTRPSAFFKEIRRG